MGELELLERLAETNAIRNDEPLPADWNRSSDDHGELSGSDRMVAIHATRPAVAEPRRSAPNWWQATIAAAIIAIVAVAAWTLFNGTDEVADGGTTTTVAPATTPPTTVAPTTLPPSTSTTASGTSFEAEQLAIAESLVDAFFAHDEETLLSTVGDVADVEGVLHQLRTSAALNGSLISREDCAVTSDDLLGQVRIDCEFEDETDLTRAFNSGPTPGLLFVRFADDTTVTQVVYETETPTYILGLFAWLNDNGSEEALAACTDTGEARGQEQYDNCWALTLAFVPDYIASDAYEGPAVP